MCGIAGILNYQGSGDEMSAVGVRMLSTMHHRGPDDSGKWIDINSGLFLGHRRLAIQDLSELGAQPMLSASKRYCIVFNGEIYNFKEIASELIRLGHTFRGHSDTEVILAAIDEWGIASAIDKCIGMFAIALWDIKRRELILLRDRLGEKPLYYGLIGNTFYFASELKAIESVIPRDRLLLDKVALNAFLKYGFIDAPHSIYSGIFKLIPGSIITLAQKDIESGKLPDSTPYWDIYRKAEEGIASPYESETEVIQELNEILKKTIRRQLIADVSVGTFLSGGIDSTLVSAIAQSESSDKLKTFTIGYHEKQYDESSYAEKIAQYIGSDHKTVYVTPKDTLDVIPELPYIYDEPFSDSSQIPTYLVSKIARNDVTVCLSGDGGDELFAGYNRYMWLAEIWNKFDKLPYNLRSLLSKLISIPSPHTWESIYSLLTAGKRKNKNYKQVGIKIQKMAGLLRKKDIYEAYDDLLSYWNNPSLLLSQDFQYEYSSRPEHFPNTESFISKAMYWDQSSYLPGDNLAKVDRASMRVSLETRLPLLSHEILEFSWRIPVSLKVKGTTGKWMLRKLLETYIPREYFERPKMGFSVPVSNWLRNDLKQWSEDLIFSAKFRETGMFDMNLLKKYWHEHNSGKYDHSHRLWTILMLFGWLKDRI